VCKKVLAEKTELKRAVWHFLSVSLIAMLFYVSNRMGVYCLLGVGILCLIGDWGRTRFNWINRLVPKFFFSIMREHETRGLSALSYFVVAGMIIISIHLLFGLPKDIMVCATMFVAIGDPMARLIGKNWKVIYLFGSKIRSIRLYKRKTLFGSMAFFLCGLAGAAGFYWISEPVWPVACLLVGGVVATVTELLAHREWDNFYVPLLASLTMWGVM